MLRLVAPLALVALFSGPVLAQIEVGQKAVLPEAKTLGFTKMKSLAETRGKLVLLEYFAYW
ncbi:MAG: hypothetical protein RL148_2343 [Planctomycetota bacterium]|jgi:hypothetical protein